jgi:FkbM family methyltransferase
LGPLRPVARAAFRRLLSLRYGSASLMRAEQNGRTWLLAPEVALRGELAEFETIQWFRDVVREGMTVIDVGANVGQMTLELAELVGPSGRVIAVEPAPGNLELLRRHIEANGYSSRVEVFDGACSDANGTVKLYLAGTTDQAVGSGHTLAGEAALRRQDGSVRVVEKTVTAVTVDALCEERSIRPSVIKIDVEGAELSVLRGMKQTLRSSRPAVRVGFHPFAFDSPEDASDQLRALFDAADYALQAPASGALALEEYIALPREPSFAR